MTFREPPCADEVVEYIDIRFEAAIVRGRTVVPCTAGEHLLYVDLEEILIPWMPFSSVQRQSRPDMGFGQLVETR